MKTLTYSALALSLGGVLSACLLEEKKDTPKTRAGNYVLAISTTAGNGTDYIMTVSSLDSGTISASGRGIEQTGYRHMHAFQNLFFSVGYQADNHLIAYYKDATDTALAEKGRLVFPATMDLISEVDSASAIALEAPRTGLLPRTLFRLNLGTVSIADTAMSSIYQLDADSMTVWPTGLIHRDGKIFLSFYHVHGRGDFSVGKNTDTAYVAVFDYPSLNFVKVIKDVRGGAIGLYANNRGIIKTASNDIYAYSCASYLCNTTDSTVEHSKILRIKNGTTEWDASYEFDFEAATGKKLVWFTPAGGELALARAMAVPAAEDSGKIGGAKWAAIGAGPVELYIINLATKTATPVTGVPAHKGAQRMNSFVENGKIYVPVVVGTDNALYSIDTATKVGVKGATIVGGAVKLIAR